MQCPSCGTEAGTAEFCPRCLAALNAPPPAKVEAPPASSGRGAPLVPEKATEARKGWAMTGATMLVAAALGAAVAWYLSHHLKPQAAECAKLCEFAEIPAVANNPVWQEQVKQYECRCNALPKQAPPAEPVKPPPGPPGR